MELSKSFEKNQYGISHYRIPKLSKKKLILDQSFEMIQKDGLQNFSMKRLCQNLEMAQSGIFYYYNNVTILFSELIKKQILDETNFLLAQIQMTRKPKRAIKRYFFYFIEYYLARPELFKLVYLNPASNSFDEKTKIELEEDQESLLAYLEYLCDGITDNDLYEFRTSVKGLKLQAQSLIAYYFLQASDQSKIYFENLCKQSWKNFSFSLFKD